MSYSPPDDCDPPARVTVGGTRIPVINDGIRTEMVRDAAVGEGYITKHSEVYFPAVWPFKLDNDDVGRDYLGTIDALDPDAGTNYDYADVDIRDHRTGEFRTIHRGFVMGVGGGARGDIERRITIGDAGQMLNTINLPQKMEVYDEGTSLKTILDDVVAELNDKTEGIFTSVSLGGVPEDIDTVRESREETNDGVLGEINEVVSGGSGLIGGFRDFISTGIVGLSKLGLNVRIPQPKNFDPARDTLADVLAWIQGRVDGYFEIVPDDSTGIQLVLNKRADKDVFQAKHIGGDTQVLGNNALYEITPMNGIISKGKEKNNKVPYSLTVASKLLDAANGNQYFGEVYEVDSTSLDNIERKGEKELKSRIHNSSLGRILTQPTPVTPHNNIQSQPVCGKITGNTPSLTWEADSVVHNISAMAEDDEYRHQTEIKVTPSVLIGEDTETAGLYVPQDASTATAVEKLKTQFRDTTAPGPRP